MNMLSEGSEKLKTVKLTIQKEDDDYYIIGNPNLEKFIGCNKKATDMISMLNGENSLLDIQLATNSTDSEIKDLILTLKKENLIFVDSFYDEEVLISPIKRSIGKIFFNSGAIFIYILCGLFILFTRMQYPQYLPTVNGFFWSGLQSFNILSFILFSALSLGIHEAGHVIAGFAYGAKTQVRLSNRLYFLVVETRFADIYKLPLNKRIVIYLAGIFFDLVSISVAILIQFQLDLVAPYNLLIKQFILVVILGILWEFMIFMKTDIYFVFSEFFKVFNLQSHAIIRLKNLMHKRDTWDGVELTTDRKKQIIQLYSVLFIIGTLVFLIKYFVYLLPITISVLLNTSKIIQAAYLSGNYKLFIDSGASFVMIAAYLSTLAVVVLRHKHRTN